MATLQVLRTAYSDVARIKFSNIPSSDLTKLQALAQQVDASTLTLSQAQAEIGKMVVATTSVANLAYAFFTGATPSSGGLNFLVSPTGDNGNNLNSAYYQSFTAENRYINFAVNLGKFGEGQTRFAAAYGALDLKAAATKAYVEIFGFAPAAGIIDSILDGQVPNGAGGTYSRAEYFAYYGTDGLTGIGTKAAVVGWLLNEAAKADLGVYAKANDALLADLAADGQAAFNVDLLGVYGPQPTFAAGATITVTDSQSVSQDAVNTALRSTANNDAITGTGSNASQTISTGDGHDVITFSGAVGGYIDGGAGNDTITLGALNASVPVLGGAPNGTVAGGAGNDKITIGRVVDGAIIDGGAGDDTLAMGIVSELFSKTKITNVEHLVLTEVKITFGGIDARDFSGLRDITTRGADAVAIGNIADGVMLKMDGVTAGGLTATYFSNLVFSGPSSVKVGARSADVYLNNVSNSGATPTKLSVGANDGVLTLHVQSNSVLDTIKSESATGILSPVVIVGTGRLTAAFDAYNVDASGAAGVTATRIGVSNSYVAQTIVLSGESDQITADFRSYAKQSFTLGGGADTVSIYQDGFSPPRFANLMIENGQATMFATITDFAKGVDHINLGTVIPAVVTGLSAGTATTLEQALINVSSQVAANATAVFEYGGDTFVYHQDATVGVNTGDGLIRLVGVTGLSVGTGAASVDIHYG